MAATRFAPAWLVHVGVAGLALGASIVAVVVAGFVLGLGSISGAYMCGPDVSEGTLIAPASLRGRVLCTVGTEGPDFRDWVAVAVMFTAPVAALGVVASWLRTRSWRRVEVGLTLVVLLPALLLVVVAVLPAGCTDSQRDTYGAAGCERDIESRND